MMNIRKNILVAGLILASTAGVKGQGIEIISDTYTAPNSNGSFELGLGVNSGISTNGTRLTGLVAENLRYILRDTSKAVSAYGINGNRLRVQNESGAGRFVLSANGSTPFNFGSALGVAGATPANPAIYEIRTSMDNDATGTQRMSFALGTTDGNNATWDFGVQIFKVSGASVYSVAHRVDIGSSGTSDVTGIINSDAGAFGSEINILMRVTDAGAETNSFNSRLQLSLDDGVTWFYDTQTDPLLPNGWRLDGANRFIMWDIAGGTVARYDNFSITSIYAPAIPTATWTGGGADDNWSTGDNWGGTAPAGGTALVFDGTSRQINNNDILDLSAPWLVFNNGGFSLSGNPLDVGFAITNAAGENTINGNLTFGSTVAKSWNVAAGSELVLNNTVDVEVGGDHDFSGGGTLRVKGNVNIGVATTANPAIVLGEGQIVFDGAIFTSRGGFRTGSFPIGSGARTVLTNGATVTLTTSGGNFRVGDSANANPTVLDINNSSLVMSGGSLGIPYAANAVGQVNQVGGTVSGAVVAFSDAGAGNGVYTVQNGVLEPLQIREDNAAGTSAIHFNNATLRVPVGANSAFFSGIDIAEIQAGGLTIDAQSDGAVIEQSLSGAGSLTKTGFGSVTLSGNNSYLGNTLVQGGKLYMTTGQTNNDSIQVSDGAEFGVTVSSPGSSRQVSNLTLGGGSFSTLNFNLASFASPTAPLLKVDNLSVNGPVTVNVANGVALTTGQIVLVDYSGAIGGGFNFSIGSLPIGVTADLVNNTANSSIDLNITAVPGLRWTGAIDGNWDNFTQNWIDMQTGSPTSFFDGYPTEFLDGASTGSILINDATFPTPTILTVSNQNLAYVWTGGIITTPVLRKNGSGSLTRAGGEADAIGAIELNAGSYIFNNFFNVSLTNILLDQNVGTGNFVKQGVGQVTLSAASPTYDGAITIAEGEVKMGVADALGSTVGATTIASGATLDLNNLVAPHEPVIVSGAGVGGVGAIIDSASATGVANNLTDVTMVGDTTFGAPTGGRWDIRVRGGTGVGPGLRGNGYNLTKVGSGALSIACQRHFSTNQPYWEMNLGDVLVSEGSLTFAESLSLGNPSKTITLASGTSLGTFDLNYTNPIVRNIFMTDASISSSGGADGTNAFAGTISISGVATLRPLDAKLVVDGAIVGSGSVVIDGNNAGVVYLNGANTYTGDTTVSATALGGRGVIPGNLTVPSGTSLLPGMGVGTLTVNGNASLAGTTIMELDRSLSPNSDQLVVAGSLSWGGVLRVVLGAGAASPQAGDVYQLFNKAGSGAFTDIQLPNISGLPGGLTWDTSNLSVDGTIRVNGTATPPTFGSVYMDGGNFVFSGTGGVEGAGYVILASPDVSAPIANWIPVATNTFGAGGSFSHTNAIDGEDSAMFYLLQLE